MENRTFTISENPGQIALHSSREINHREFRELMTAFPELAGYVIHRDGQVIAQIPDKAGNIEWLKSVLIGFFEPKPPIEPPKPPKGKPAKKG